MGIVNPRPAMRGAEARLIVARLRVHAQRTAAYVLGGMDREAASRKAYDEVRAMPANELGVQPKKRGSR